MTISSFKQDFFRVISDGERVAIINNNEDGYKCYLLESSIMTCFRTSMNRNMVDCTSFGGIVEFIPGIVDYSIDLTLKCGKISVVDKPLVMGVDLFRRFSITDYLDIINKKIQGR